MCTRPVQRAGDTCDLDCYRHLTLYLEAAGPHLPVGMPVPNSMETQPWYAAEQERIDAHAEAHELD